MKHRRITAITLALALLLSLMPSALAAVGTDWNDECRGNPSGDGYGKHNWVKQDEVPGNNCTSPGIAFFRCSYCGASASQDTSAPGHNWGGWTTTQAATCAADGVETRACQRCGATENRAVPATGSHSWGGWTTSKPATCTEGGSESRSCSVCGKSESRGTSALGHSWGDWSVSRAPTCTAEGEEARACQRCGARETRPVAMTAHTFENWRTTREPTCARKGEKTRKCAVCGLKETKDVDPLPHTYGEWTVTRETTCTEKGEKTRTCEECGHVDTQAVELLPHSYGDWTVTLAPTCTQAGERTHTCAVCGREETEVVPMVPHDFGEWIEIAPATCTQGGEQRHTCAACGKEESEAVPPRGHRFGAWTTIVEMTDFSVGVRERKCERCGYAQQEEQEPQPTYRRGDKGDGVRGLQEALNAAGFNCGKADGDFGKKTEAAVKAVEQAHDFQADGIAWPGVQKWLGMDAGGKGPGDDSAPLPDDINSTYKGNTSLPDGVFEDQGVAFSPRRFEVVSIPENDGAYYEGANVVVKLRLTIDNIDGYRMVKYDWNHKDNLYTNDWIHSKKPLEPGSTHDMTYGMILRSDLAGWHKRTITLWLENLRTGAIEQESVEFGPPWSPATVTLVDEDDADHIAGDYWATLYLEANRDEYASHVTVFDMTNIPINVDSDGNCVIRDLKLTVEQVNVNHGKVIKTDTFDLRKKMQAGDGFDWVGTVMAYPPYNYAETHSIHLTLSGTYYDKYNKKRTVESNMVSLNYCPIRKEDKNARLSLEYYIHPGKNVYGPGDRVNVNLHVINNGSGPLTNPSVDFAGASKEDCAKWEPIKNVPAGTTLQPGESASAICSYTLRQEDFDNGSVEVDFIARAESESSELPVIAPCLHVSIPCAQFLEQEMYLYAKVDDKQAAYLPGATVPVTLRLNTAQKFEASRGFIYSVGDNCDKTPGGNDWHDFGHGVSGYVYGSFGAFKKPKYMNVSVTIPESFTGGVFKAAWVAEADFTEVTGGGTYRSNVAMVELPILSLADEEKELALDVEPRTVCPHEDGIWQVGDEVDVKLTATFKRGKTPDRVTITGTDSAGNQVACISGEKMPVISDTVHLTLDDSLKETGQCVYTFRADAVTGESGGTSYYTPAHTLTFDLKPQDKGSLDVKASIISENLNPDGKWRVGDKARVRIEGKYIGPIIPKKMDYSAYRPGNTESPFEHNEIWYSMGIANEFVVQLEAADVSDGAIVYTVTFNACEGESDKYTCSESTQVTFEMSEEPGGAGPDASGMGADEMPDAAASAGSEAIDPAFTGEATETGIETGETAETTGETAEIATETGETTEPTGETAEIVTETVEATEPTSGTAETVTETGETTETTGEIAGTVAETGETTETGTETTETGEAAPSEAEAAGTVEPEASGVEASENIEPETAESIEPEAVGVEDGGTVEPESVEPMFEGTIVSIPGDVYDIPATICLPKGEGPFPAVVMLHGTGSNRDEAGDGYRFAAPILAERYGIATIRIDFPGNGDSAADYTRYNFHSAVADAKAAADYMAALDCVDADAIGVMGWSQGGTDALLACAWEPETFKSVVTWAGAPDMMLDGFFTEEDYAEARANGSFVMEFDWRDSLNVSLQWCDDVANTDVLKAFSEGYAGPVLAIAGTDDTTVDPRWSVRIAEASRNPRSRTRFIVGMDHTFNVFTEADLRSLREAVEATGAFFVETLAAR